MDEANEYELKQEIVAHLRRTIQEALAHGSLPANTVRLLESCPDSLLETVVDTLMPLILKQRRSGALVNDGDMAYAINSLMNDQNIKILIFGLLSTHQAGAPDKDLDGALLFCGRANKMLKTERYQEAKAFFQRAIEIKEDVRQSWVGLAEALDHLGETEAAERARRRAQQL